MVPRPRACSRSRVGPSRWPCQVGGSDAVNANGQSLSGVVTNFKSHDKGWSRPTLINFGPGGDFADNGNFCSCKDCVHAHQTQKGKACCALPARRNAT